mmetsp:Transcript_7261/g.10623  ORF Transcript_7261/g.10623 Transcript_7261/m.10623 type:complete len:133 (-) Transcript_7261:170-568(-)|eukprot:CAMPEP_0194254150 /NCGR_PEP_ID=MMETSP0158-20130606/31472_1 /TAXON_ID=33649 /ORGANISM="Thalassionema nitzschioides, Strain L26-B" /LENGTH=132 /DNA_ID=CAMNT_0038992075 /DNA_START=44 /DNA_END=442 /DNA_ORIENTATION=-
MAPPAFLDATTTEEQQPHWFHKLRSFCDPNQMDDASCEDSSAGDSAIVASAPRDFLAEEPMEARNIPNNNNSTENLPSEMVSKSPRKPETSIQIQTYGASGAWSMALMFVVACAAVLYTWKGDSLFGEDEVL